MQVSTRLLPLADEAAVHAGYPTLRCAVLRQPQRPPEPYEYSRMRRPSSAAPVVSMSCGMPLQMLAVYMLPHCRATHVEGRTCGGPGGGVGGAW